MTELLENALRVVVIGVGATLVMDLWLFVLKRLGLPTLNMAYLGRWLGHLFGGRWQHDGIAKTPAVNNELALGWLAHYAIGIGFAATLISICGAEWARTPSVLPALLFGVGTIVAPLFVMQPAMGAGIASSRTPTPIRNCLQSLATHTVFGFGLYVAALTMATLD